MEWTKKQHVDFWLKIRNTRFRSANEIQSVFHNASIADMMNKCLMWHMKAAQWTSKQQHLLVSSNNKPTKIQAIAARFCVATHHRLSNVKVCYASDILRIKYAFDTRTQIHSSLAKDLIRPGKNGKILEKDAVFSHNKRTGGFEMGVFGIYLVQLISIHLLMFVSLSFFIQFGVHVQILCILWVCWFLNIN